MKMRNKIHHTSDQEEEQSPVLSDQEEEQSPGDSGGRTITSEDEEQESVVDSEDEDGDQIDVDDLLDLPDDSREPSPSLTDESVSSPIRTLNQSLMMNSLQCLCMREIYYQPIPS